MSKVIDGLLYAKSHEWVKVSDGVATIGITDYAQHSLGEIVYVEFSEVGDEVTKGEEFGAVESVKAASDIYAPVSGKVVEVNESLIEQPELINKDAFSSWMIKVEISDESELEDLLDSKSYEGICK